MRRKGRERGTKKREAKRRSKGTGRKEGIGALRVKGKRSKYFKLKSLYIRSGRKDMMELVVERGGGGGGGG